MTDLSSLTRNELDKKIKQNDAEAALELGQRAYYGRGMDVDKELAMKVLRKAAESNLPEAQYLYALLLGSGVKGRFPDEIKAFRWVKRASEQNYLPAICEYGICLVSGNGVKADFIKGRDVVKKAADAGYGRAKLYYADMYFYGPYSGSLSEDEVIKLYEDAGQAGETAAYITLGNLFGKANRGQKENFDKAYDYYRIAFEKGNYEALLNKGLIMMSEIEYIDTDQEKAEQYKKIIELFSECANKYHVLPAYYFLAELYFDCRYIPQDIIKAKDLLQKLYNEIHEESSKNKAALNAKKTYLVDGDGNSVQILELAGTLLDKIDKALNDKAVANKAHPYN